jgi:hypothetical protein
MDIMDIMDIMIITAFLAMAGAVLALVLWRTEAIHFWKPKIKNKNLVRLICMRGENFCLNTAHCTLHTVHYILHLKLYLHLNLYLYTSYPTLSIAQRTRHIYT